MLLCDGLSYIRWNLRNASLQNESGRDAESPHARLSFAEKVKRESAPIRGGNGPREPYEALQQTVAGCYVLAVQRAAYFGDYQPMSSEEGMLARMVGDGKQYVDCSRPAMSNKERIIDGCERKAPKF